MKRAITLFTRGLLLRCPICGKGHIFRTWFKMNETCPHCHFRFDRGEEGYFSFSMAINLVISELIIAAFTIPLALNSAIPIWQVIVWGLPFPFLLPFLFYHHSRGLFLALDHIGNPTHHPVPPNPPAR